MPWGEWGWVTLCDPSLRLLGRIMDCIYIQNGNVVRDGPELHKETIDGTQGGCTYKLHQEEIHTNYSSHQPTPMLSVPSEAIGRLTSGQRGFCSEETTARKGLCWRQPKGSSPTAFDHSSDSLSMGWPRGKRPVLGETV